MRMNIIKMTAGMICLASMMQPVFAENGYESSSSAPPSTSDGYSSSASGYSSSASAPPSTTTTSSYSSSAAAPPSTTTTTSEYKHKKHDRFSLNLTIPGTNTVVKYRAGNKHHRNHYSNQEVYWVAMEPGQDVPNNAVIGGNQYNPNAMFYVCRANYRGGVHPGKFFSGNCNISWGGREVVVSQDFEILVSQLPLGWTSASFGAIPANAVEGGSEDNHPLYICQANYRNGTHTGKIVGKNCNFGWGGREVMTPNYNVLVG